MKLKSSLTAVFTIAALLVMGSALSTPVAAQYVDPSKKVLRAPVAPSPQNRPAPQYKPPVVHSQGQHGHGGHQGNKHRSNTGRNVAAGVAAGVIGAIILNEAAKASSSGHSSSDDGELSCRQLERRCDDGKDWACRKYDRRGC